MKEGFKSIKEILEEVAEEEGIPIRQIRDIWRHQEHYVKKLMDEGDIYSIFLPYIGTLCLNTKQYDIEIKNRIREKNQKFIDKVERLKNHENYTEFDNPHKKVNGVNRLARRIIKDYHTGLEKARRLIRHKKCWPIIEKYSNGGYEKREKKLIRYKRKKENYDKP